MPSSSCSEELCSVDIVCANLSKPAYVDIIERPLTQWDDLKRLGDLQWELPLHKLHKLLSCPHNRLYQTVETPLAAQRMVAVCTLTNSWQRYKLRLPDYFITTEAENFHDLKLLTYYYYRICGQAKLSDFSVMSLLIYCFIWVVVRDGWLAICLSLPIHLPISHSHLFRAFLMISSVYILCCTHLCPDLQE